MWVGGSTDGDDWGMREHSRCVWGEGWTQQVSVGISDRFVGYFQLYCSQGQLSRGLGVLKSTDAKAKGVNSGNTASV